MLNGLMELPLSGKMVMTDPWPNQLLPPQQVSTMVNMTNADIRQAGGLAVMFWVQQ